VIDLPNQSATSPAKRNPHFVQGLKSVRNSKRCYSAIIPVPGAVLTARKWIVYSQRIKLQ